MKKMHYKRILGIFIVTLTLLAFSVTTVNADTAVVECPGLANVNWAERYNLTFKSDSSDQMSITMGKITDSKLSKVSGIKLQIDSISTYIVGDDGNGNDVYDIKTTFSGYSTVRDKFITSSKKKLVQNRTITLARTDELKDGDGVMVTLVPDLSDTYWSDPIVKTTCGDAYKKVTKETFEIHLYMDIAGSETIYELDDGIDRSDENQSVDDDYDCSGSNSKFCDGNSKWEDFTPTSSKKASGGRDYLLWSDKYNEDAKFTCDWQKTVKGVATSDNEYYVNKSYLYGKASVEKNVGTYAYHYECKGDDAVTEKVTCKIECKEIVEVEYGPPVAATAGLCFEYKVKVTSKVQCKTKQKPKAPKKQKLCTPVPQCVHGGGGGRIYKQGGPNEEFDSCIDSCDGGIYSDKCVNKCYKQVYGTSVSRQVTGTEIAYAAKLDNTQTATVEKVADKTATYKYVCNPNRKDADKKGIIYFDNGTTVRTSTSTDSPWHQTHAWGIRGHNYACYDTNGNGIPRTCSCSDNCTWIGCTGDVYLNKSQYDADVKNNKDTYQRAKSECKAAASCSTTTAEFTMSVDYTKTNGVVKTVKFPFSVNGQETDVLRSQGTDKNHTSLTKNAEIKDLPTILGYNGCYKSEDEKNWYQTEWSFPGTWQNPKTHEISYVKPSGDSWKENPNKFCIPANAKDVNQRWWIYYYAKYYANDPKYSYNNAEYLSNAAECVDENGSSKLTSCNYASMANNDVNKIAKNSLTYNITGRAKEFGMFGWDITVKCFYALYTPSEFDCTNNVSGSANNQILPNCPKKGNEKYRVRSVDLKDLFPNPSGAKTSSDTTGRAPGFNWSQFADITYKSGGSSTVANEQRTEYIANPSSYTKWVQKQGYSVYSDNYLDYEVKLTRDEINKLRDTGRNYTNYQDNYTSDKYVTHYQSKLIRSELKKTKYPGQSALVCNNIGSHTPSAGYNAQCEKFE